MILRDSLLYAWSALLCLAVVALTIAGCEDARITCRSTCAPHGVPVATSTACVCRAPAGEGR